MFRCSQQQIIIFAYASCFIPRLHRIYFRSGAIHISIRTVFDSLFQKLLHPHDIGLKSMFHLIEMFRMHHSSTIDIYHSSVSGQPLFCPVPDIFHLPFIIQVIFKKKKSGIFPQILYRIRRTGKKIIKSNHPMA